MSEFIDAMFADRKTAGRALAERLRRYRGGHGVVVLGLPRGGVAVAAELARVLNLPLDVLVVRRLSLLSQPALTLGAIAGAGSLYVNRELVRHAGIRPDALEAAVERERIELQRRERLYRRGRPPLALRGKTVILVDELMLTGASLQAAVKAVRGQQPNALIVALPAAPAGSAERFEALVDEFVCTESPAALRSAAECYVDDARPSDADVLALLQGRSADL